MKFTHCLLVSALAIGTCIATQETPTFAQDTLMPPPRVGDRSDSTAGMRASLKARFGFSDAQATTVIRRSQAIAMSYRPRFLALQKKYLSNGRTPTPEQRRRFQREAIPLFEEVGKKTNAVLLAVANKEQRPRVLAQINAAKSQSKSLN